MLGGPTGGAGPSKVYGHRDTMSADMTTAEYTAQQARTMSEATFQTDVIELAHLHNWRVAHFRTVAVKRKNGTVHYQTPVQADGAGWPDLFMCRKDRAIAAELKSHRGVTSDDQKAWLAALAWADIEVYEWKPIDMAEIERILQ